MPHRWKPLLNRIQLICEEGRSPQPGNEWQENLDCSSILLWLQNARLLAQSNASKISRNTEFPSFPGTKQAGLPKNADSEWLTLAIEIQIRAIGRKYGFEF